jgi:chromosome condensin MukBEF MukE localization factor
MKTLSIFQLSTMQKSFSFAQKHRSPLDPSPTTLFHLTNVSEVEKVTGKTCLMKTSPAILGGKQFSIFSQLEIYCEAFFMLALLHVGEKCAA